jgi:tetratricopeptide (TPR) repeat protein
MHGYRLALESALAKARDGREAEAVEQLLPLLDQAVADANLNWISLLARNGAILSEHLGNHQRAVDFLELSIMHFPDDPRTLLQLGDLYLLQGDADRAKKCFTTCRTVCQTIGKGDGGYGDVIELLTLVQRRLG